MSKTLTETVAVNAAPVPTAIRLHKSDGSLTLAWPDGSEFRLSGEYLRVFSPSAEVRGHGPGQEVLQHGKKDVKVVRVEPAGNYALVLHFSDGHDTGIYAWRYLHDLCVQQEQRWDNYLEKLHAAGKAREANASVVRLVQP